MAIRDFITRVFNDNGGPMGLCDFMRVESRYSRDKISCALASMARQGLLLPTGNDKFVPNNEKWAAVKSRLQNKARKKAEDAVARQLQEKRVKQAPVSVKKQKLTIKSDSPIEPTLLMTIQGLGYSVTDSNVNKLFHRYEFERGAQ